MTLSFEYGSNVFVDTVDPAVLKGSQPRYLRGDSDAVPFWALSWFLVRQFNELHEKELQSSLQVVSAFQPPHPERQRDAPPRSARTDPLAADGRIGDGETQVGNGRRTCIGLHPVCTYTQAV